MKKKSEDIRNRTRGSLFGGAAGDALGYTVEFWIDEQIKGKYGEEGITEYELKDGKALISDDTQMSLFTANGILRGITRNRKNGTDTDLSVYVSDAYLDWLATQEYTFADVAGGEIYHTSWISDIPELYSRRAPGHTCRSALRALGKDGYTGDYLKKIRNHSKGCGGVMRVAPIGMITYDDLSEMDMEGAQLAAITHSHTLGYMPAVMLAHIVNRAVYSPSMGLGEIVKEANETAASVFSGYDHIDELIELIQLAVSLSKNDHSDSDNIRRLGEGWVAEETLAIAVYCSLRYENDFSKGIIAAVNHDGDSDSTGAVTGNILGAIAGYDSIEDKWKKDLELADTVVEMADDICTGNQILEGSIEPDEKWLSKYL